MKLGFILLFSFVAHAGLEHSVQFGLDSTHPDVKNSTPVVIYLGNDVQAPVTSDGLVQNLLYLENGLSGKQHYVGPNKVFTQEELDSFTKLSIEDQTVLKKVADWIKHDFSPKAETYDYWTLRNGICRKNPKYRSALVVVRNFFMSRTIEKGGITQVRAEHCGPDLTENTSSEFMIDANLAGESVFNYPFSEQVLSHPGFVRATFEKIAEIYPPKNHRYLIIVHSASAPGFVLSPHMSFLVSGISIEKIRKSILDRREQFFYSNGKLKEDRSFFLPLHDAILAVDSSLKADRGVSTDQFLETLESIPDLKAPLVALDTNGQDFTILSDKKLNRVGTVYYTKNPAPLDIANDFRSLFYFVGVKATDLEARFREILSR